MISCTDAKAIALKTNNKLNSCCDYGDAYCFYEKDVESDGGNTALVVLKSTGKIVGLTTYIVDYRPKKKPKQVKF